MKSMHIRQLEDSVVEALKRRARRHHRSLQKEVESLLIDAARMIPPEEAEGEDALAGLITVSTSRSNSHWSRESIYGGAGR